MNRVVAFIEKDRHPLVPILMILFVGFSRLLLEIGLFRGKYYSSNFLMDAVINVSFYLVVFILFSLLFRFVLALPFRYVSNAVSVGLLFGVIPPLIDIFFLSSNAARYIYYSQFTWSLFSKDQSISESIVLWMIIIGSGVFTLAIKKSIIRCVLAVIGSYLIIQACTGVVLLVKYIGIRNAFWINIAWISISFIGYIVLREKALLKSLSRVIHVIPHAMLVFCGSAWVGKRLLSAVDEMLLMIVLGFVIVIHNDYYDRKEDRIAGRKTMVENRDVIFSSFFLFTLLFLVFVEYPILSFLMLLFFIVGCMYQHPAIRLKDRFCLSYKAEGIAALLSFLVGTVDKNSFPEGAAYLVPCLLVLFGGSLLSITKDWKDIETDSKNKKPTYYVILKNRGRDFRTSHRMIVASITIGMLIPPIAFTTLDEVNAIYCLSAALAFVPGIILLFVRNRTRAVMWTLGSLSLYIAILALSTSYFRSGAV